MITMRQIEAFKAIMEAGTVSQAAQAMHLSQPSVSRLLSDLESKIGYRLFSRAKGRLVARDEARELYAEVRRSFSGLTRISEAAAQIGRQNADRLRIAVMPMFNLPPLARVVAQLLARSPDASISFSSRSKHHIEEEIALGHHDVALATLPISRSDVGALPIANTDYVCLVPEGHALCGRDAIAPNDLAGVRVIFAGDARSLRRRVDQWLTDAGAQCTLRMDAMSMQMAYSLVAEGAGVTITLRAIAANLSGPRVRPIEFHPRLSADICALFPIERPPRGLAAGFVTACSEALS